jgi:hypothetical protein
LTATNSGFRLPIGISSALCRATFHQVLSFKSVRLWLDLIYVTGPTLVAVAHSFEMVIKRSLIGLVVEIV